MNIWKGLGIALVLVAALFGFVSAFTEASHLRDDLRFLRALRVQAIQQQRARQQQPRVLEPIPQVTTTPPATPYSPQPPK